MNVKVNDTVLVITGKYKGKQGKVLAAYPKNNRVIVEGVNIVHKHEKARKANETSRIVTEEAPIDVSNVEVVCDKCGKATRVAHSLADGKKSAHLQKMRRNARQGVRQKEQGEGSRRDRSAQEAHEKAYQEDGRRNSR